MIEHDHVRRQQAFARLLIETSRILSASLLRTNVCFAANLCPNFWTRFDRQIAERPVACCARPLRQPLQFASLRAGEKFLLALHCALESARAQIILPAFHQRCLKLDRQHFFQDWNVFVQQLFLKINSVRGNDCLFVLLQREQDRRHQVSQRFTHSSARFDYQMLFFFQRLPHTRCHLLLLWTELEILCLRQRTFLRKKATYAFHEFTA